MKGNKNTIVRDSYKPFSQTCKVPPILGMLNRMINNTLHQKKAFFIKTYVEVRYNNKPAKNGYITLVKPILNCSGSNDHPPIKSPE
jgi:hypothetical protein